MKIRLSSLTQEELKALADVYHDRWRKNWLRTNGWTNIFLGGLTLWLGLSGLAENSFPKLVQTLAGALIVGQSLWSIVSPSTGAILRFAALFLGAGIWNTLLAVDDGFLGAALLVGLLGIAQLWWAFQSYREYQRYRSLELPETQAEMVRFYDEVWRAITSGAFKGDSASIHLWIGLSLCQGLLLENKVVFAVKGQKLLVIQGKDEANFVPNSSKPMKKRRVYGRIKLNAIFERAMMKRDSFEKYALWKGEEAVLAEVTPSLWRRLPRAIRIVLMVIGGLVFAYIVFVAISIVGALIKYG
jgi:hypothetical protein